MAANQPGEPGIPPSQLHRYPADVKDCYPNFEQSPAKRRRLLYDQETVTSIQLGTSHRSDIYGLLNGASSTAFPTAGAAQSTSMCLDTPQSTTLDLSSRTTSISEWSCRMEWSAQSQHMLSGENPSTKPTHHPSTESTSLPSIIACDQICFGMINDLLAEIDGHMQFVPDNNLSATFHPPATLSVKGMSLEAKLIDRSAQILQALLSESTIEAQIILTPPKNRKLRESRLNTNSRRVSISVFVILYGPESLLHIVGSFCQQCDLYLQDPHGCDRNVPYRNPHCLFSIDDELRMTFDLNQRGVNPNFIQLQQPNWLDTFITQRALQELETPPMLRTQLLQHQRQALYFMTRRELGWAYEKTSYDIWTEERGSYGKVLGYCNNITGESQPCRPIQFRGGILADEMGLGKSYSMIALIASDIGNHIKLTDSESAVQGTTNISATLLIVPPSLLHTWEDEFIMHMRSPKSLRIRRHHASGRISSIEQLQQYDIIITTYQTIEREWRGRLISEPSPLFSVFWRRIILDEAHYVSNRLSNTFKAVCALEAHYRWAVTGTPLQNRLGDLATMCQFLRVHPYDDREVFERDIMHIWKAGNNDVAITRLKGLIHCIMLRRTNRILNLPKRTDLQLPLELSYEERMLYNKVERNVAARIDDVLNRTTLAITSYTTILQQINKLRRICNLGTHGETSKEVCPTQNIEWSNYAAQEALSALKTMETLLCNVCGLDLDATGTGNSLGLGLIPPPSRLQLSRCLRIVCESCLGQQPMSCCDCRLSCPTAIVSYTLGMIDSAASTPAELSTEEEEPTSTKIKALINDLLCQSSQIKSIVFTFWTSTLDIIGKSLTQASITYERYDGTTSPHLRSLALKQFQEDPEISVILMTISCAAVGLNITAASRVYIMEPQWNPTVEEQALARVHRIGQTRDVTTIRFIMKDTFEERVVETQKRKRDLAKLLLSPEPHAQSEHSLERLRYFRSLLK